MNMYTVILRTRDNKKVEKTIYADSVSYDSHWVSFHQYHVTEPVQEQQGCDNCGRRMTLNRVRGPQVKTLTAIYPSPLVDGVEIQWAPEL